MINRNFYYVLIDFCCVLLSILALYVVVVLRNSCLIGGISSVYVISPGHDCCVTKSLYDITVAIVVNYAIL